MSIISSYLSSLFGKKEFRVLLIGLDASGRTTALYNLKLGEVVTTIPTIGFNVEELDISGAKLTVWDVGGCDKIRPLWRHYYKNTQAVVYMVDSNDRDRLIATDDKDSNMRYNTASGLLHELLIEPELKDAVLMVMANKQDLPNALTVDELESLLQLDRYRQEQNRVVRCMPCCATSGEGLHEAMEWIVSEMQRAKSSQSAARPSPSGSDSSSSASAAPPTALTPEETEAKRMEDMMTEWLEREDESDDLFLQMLDDATLEIWDHRTHLRIAWLYLGKLGRREGMKKIFDSIKSFIERSPRTKRSDSSRGTTFHETMTYFWIHMVDYAMHSTRNPTGEFKHFILFNPQLINGGLFLHYYSRQRMLLDAEARVSVLLPDIRPLPSLLPSSVSSPSTGFPAAAAADPLQPLDQRLQPKAPMTDENFLEAFEAKVLSGWGHESKLRLIYLLLQGWEDCRPEGRTGGGRRNTDAVLEALQRVESENFHLTESYFWLQLVSYHIAVMKSESDLHTAPAAVSSSSRFFSLFSIPFETAPYSSSTLSTASPETSALDQPKVTADVAHQDPDDPERQRSALSLSPPSLSRAPFDTFFRRPLCQPLRNALLIDKYYSRSVIDAASAKTELVLPDKKRLPSMIPSR